MRLFMEGKQKEAQALLESAGLELHQLLDQDNLGFRTSSRVRSSSIALQDISMMDDINLQKKMLSAEMNRIKRDRRRKDDN